VSRISEPSTESLEKKNTQNLLPVFGLRTNHESVFLGKSIPKKGSLFFAYRRFLLVQQTTNQRLFPGGFFPMTISMSYQNRAAWAP